MKQRTHRLELVMMIILILVGRVHAEAPQRTTLHVALFPYIPDAAADHFAAMRARLKIEFEGEHPLVNLVIDPIDPDSSVFYDLPSLEKLMTPASPTGQADLVETDTLFLGELIADGFIQPLSSLPRPDDWHSAALSAVNVNGDCYGVPHWLCTFFVFSHIPEIATAHSSDDLVRILDAKGTCPVHFTGNFMGSFTLPAIYLDAYTQTHGPASAATGLARSLDSNVVGSMNVLVAEGAHDGKNLCLDGSLKDDKDITAVVPAFAEGRIDSFFGYSERLQHILTDNPKAAPWTIIAAPLGAGGSPLLYVDALVMRKGLTAQQKSAARDFSEYLNRPSTQEWVLLSKDGKHALPRYLLPATKSALHTPGLRGDRYYPMLEADIADGHAMPTSGYLERKDDMKAGLANLLTGHK